MGQNHFAVMVAAKPDGMDVLLGNRTTTNQRKEIKMKHLNLELEKLEQRVAPCAVHAGGHSGGSKSGGGSKGGGSKGGG